MNKKFFSALLALAICASAFAQVHDPVYNKDGTLNKIAGIGIDQDLGAQLPLDATFKDENGATVHLGDYLGKRPVVLNLIFYKCPGMCSLELEGLVSSFTKMTTSKTAHDVLGQDVDVLTVSIDPNEGPDLALAKKKTVMSAVDYPGADKGWHFLTGDLNNLNKLASAIGFNYTYNKDTKQISHPAGIVIASPEGKVTQYFYGTGYPEKPLHDALALAKRNEVGAKAEVLLLGCLCRDALTGKYSVNVMQTVRVLGVFTLFGLFGSMLLMNARNRHAAAKGDDASA